MPAANADEISSTKTATFNPAADDVMVDLEKARDTLQPQAVYSVRELNRLLPDLSMPHLLRDRQLGLIPRGLGEGPELHLLGADVLEWLEAGRVPECDTLHAGAPMSARAMQPHRCYLPVDRD